MKIYNLALSIVLLSTPICQAMLKVKLPDSEKLTHTFTMYGFQHLVQEIPSIIKWMADTEKSPAEIEALVDRALYFYQCRTGIPTATKPMEEKNKKLINALLKDSPSLTVE